MVARIATVPFQGVETLDIDVQVHLANGIPAFSIVGLPAKAVDQSKDRVRAALQALGLALPPQRITVNLAPADVIKEGSHYDLPVALGILAAMGVLSQEDLSEFVVLGELVLDGKLTPRSPVCCPPRSAPRPAGAASFVPESPVRKPPGRRTSRCWPRPA